MRRSIQLAAAWALVIVGLACIGLRVTERLLGGFVGAAYVFGARIDVTNLPVAPIGVAALALGCLTLIPRNSRRG